MLLQEPLLIHYKRNGERTIYLVLHWRFNVTALSGVVPQWPLSPRRGRGFNTGCGGCITVAAEWKNARTCTAHWVPQVVAINRDSFTTACLIVRL